MISETHLFCDGRKIGADAVMPSQPACAAAIAAVRAAPGVYQFIWEPDSAGRLTLHFTAGDSRLDMAVDIESAPANPVILIVFVVTTGAILIVAARMRRKRRQGVKP